MDDQRYDKRKSHILVMEWRIKITTHSQQGENLYIIFLIIYLPCVPVAAAFLPRVRRFLCQNIFAIVLHIFIIFMSFPHPRPQYPVQVVACVDFYNALLHSAFLFTMPLLDHICHVLLFFFLPPSSPLLYIRPNINLTRKARPRLCMKPPVRVGNLQHHVSTSFSNLMIYLLDSRHLG